MDPIHAAFIQGLGDITPSQYHTLSLACEIIMKTTGGLDGSPRLRARATKVRLSWSGAGIDGRWG